MSEAIHEAESGRPGASQTSGRDGWTDKALREVQLMEAGVGGFGKAAEEAFSRQHLPETAGKLLLSAGIGFALSRLTPGGGLIARVAAAGVGAAFMGDIAWNGKQVLGAMKDAFNSRRNWSADVTVMQNSLGRFAFDSALMTAGGLAGARLGSPSLSLATRLSDLSPSGRSPEILDAEYGTRSGARLTDSVRTARAQKPASGSVDAARGRPIIEVLSGTGMADYADAFKVLAEQYPEDFAGLRATRDVRLSAGADSLAIELAPGKYKDAVLRVTGLPEADPEGRPYLDWDKEWGYRPYDAQLLSDVREATLADGRPVYGYVQEKVEPFGVTGKDRDMVADATFANLVDNPQFDELMAQLESRGERFVDPGSRQLGYSPRSGRMVLIDYPAVRQSDMPRPSDSPETLPGFEEDNPQPENLQDYGFSVGDVEQRREVFLQTEPRTQAEQVRKEIASLIFDGMSTADIKTSIEWLYRDYFTGSGTTPQQAIADTRAFLTQNKLA